MSPPRGPVPPVAPHPRVSVILPCRHEEAHIGRCLDSILAGTYPRDRLEILVVDGRSDDRTREIVAEYAVRFSGIRVVDNPRRITPAALNLGIRAATGDIIVRMDAHAAYPPDYVARLVHGLEASGADNVGGVLVTVPADDSVVARAIALGLSHRLGVGNAYFRIGTAHDRWVDTVPFGCWRRELFDRIGLFDEDLVRNQDDEFNHRLQRHGGRVRLLAGLAARYYARRSLRQLARMFYQYGSFKPLVAKKVGRVMTARQLVPPAFVLALVAAAVAAPVTPWPLVAVAGPYAAVLAAAAVAAASRHGLRCALALPVVLAVLHASYGFGYLRGIAAHILGLRRRRADARALALSR